MKERKTIAPLLNTASMAALGVVFGFGTGFTGIGDAKAQGAVGTLTDEIVITARKRAQGELLQDVPVAVTAFDSDKLLALGFNGFDDIAFSIPNVGLDEIGTGRGVASFSIRGLSATSSIPSIDPAVATFVDGIYLAANAGTVLDMFDVESIEVLRGPQGTLFGRNVTGGAVLIRSKRPTEEFEAEALARLETGLDYTIGTAVQGKVADGLSMRLAAYYNKDEGYFTNLGNQIDPTINGGDDQVGENSTWFIRPSLVWEPAADLSIWLKYEHLEQQGDQPPPQNQSNFFDQTDDRVAYDFVNEGRFDVDSVVMEANWNVGPGTLTNVFGWRRLASNGGNDIDATTIDLFHSGSSTQIRSVSNEIRYAGTAFDGFWDFTTGVFYFNSEIDYVEQRRIFAGAVFSEGGGVQDTKSFAAFTENELHWTDRFSTILGVRFSVEEKEVDFTEVAGPNCEGPASFPLDHDPTCIVTSQDEDSWSTLGGKVGVQYTPSDDALMYAQWTRGFRSGGFNLRDTVADGTNPPAYDEEQLDAFEVGLKADWLDGRLRTNAALFWNIAQDLQRDVNVPVATGVQQSTANTANANIRGGEFEGHFVPIENMLLTANFGYVDVSYTDVFNDLDGDGLVTAADLDQEFPRAAEFTYGGSITYDHVMDIGVLTARVSYDHRDPVFFTDNNVTPIFGADKLGARLSLSLNEGNLQIAAFGRNLLNHIVASGSSAIFPGDPNFPIVRTFGGTGTFSPIQEGRLWGVEVNAKF